MPFDKLLFNFCYQLLLLFVINYVFHTENVRTETSKVFFLNNWIVYTLRWWCFNTAIHVPYHPHSLQRFKLNIAQSVINQDNHSLRSMGSNQLLDLFCLGNKRPSKNEAAGTDAASSLVAGPSDKKGIKAVLEDIGQLWDCNQYEEEYDLDSYVNSYAK